MAKTQTEIELEKTKKELASLKKQVAEMQKTSTTKVIKPVYETKEQKVRRTTKNMLYAIPVFVVVAIIGLILGIYGYVVDNIALGVVGIFMFVVGGAACPAMYFGSKQMLEDFQTKQLKEGVAARYGLKESDISDELLNAYAKEQVALLEGRINELKKENDELIEHLEDQLDKYKSPSGDINKEE